MTNAQKLEALVRRAVENGWEPNDRVHTADDFLKVKRSEWRYAGMKQIIPWLIFNHDFARALFGETKPLENGEYPPEVVLYKGKPVWHPWSRHLQQAVISEDPIDYMYQAVFGGDK